MGVSRLAWLGVALCAAAVAVVPVSHVGLIYGVDLLFALGPAAIGLLSARRQVDRVLAGGAAPQTRVPASS